MIPWFFHYVKNCNKKIYASYSKIYASNSRSADQAYEEIFEEIDTTDLVDKNGIIYIWSNKNLKVGN